MRLVFLCSSLSSNALGRVYSLWLLTEHLGWSSETIGRSTGAIWAPLRDNAFVSSCSDADPILQQRIILRHCRRADMVVCCKPLAPTLGFAVRVLMPQGIRVLLDIDDGDLESDRGRVPRTRGFGTPREMAVCRKLLPHSWLRKQVQDIPTIVSSPPLQRIYGGDIVPHVRRPAEPHPAVRRLPYHVAFVGTARHHKGLELLRSAVERVASLGFQLSITARAPSDAKPWEHWLGTTSVATGRKILESSHIVVTPSLDTGYSRLQFPVKLVDAMMAARAIVASDLPVHRWVLGDAGILIEPGSVEAIVTALLQLRSDEYRDSLGGMAYLRALGTFTPEAQSLVFGDIVRRALTPRQSR